ncbi:subclass B1 metallo-beta-lactamase [Bacillus massiliigorillae]|uniref:subclass B1 metallo-beta-lactamase n=1 Tax=Bacillus massiliigorillae TaxID=1243664 RepID=UPI0003A622C7|nr:subclass B1 metallo-beta-lactamase [Bacillus massiliigorillae]
MKSIQKYFIVIFTSLIVVLMSISAPVSAQEQKFKQNVITNKDESVILTKINKKVWVHTSYTEIDGFRIAANGLVLNTSKGIVLVDATWDNQLASQLLEMIQNEFHKPIKLAIITHHKYDRIGGIQALLDKNIKTISTPEVVKLAKEFNYPTPEPILNSDISKLKIGDLKIETYFPGEAHTTDNITVWLPQYKLLFGDMIFALEQQNTGIIDEANMLAWPNTMRNLLTTYSNAKIVIPGHKTWGDFSLLPHTLDVIEQYNNN